MVTGETGEEREMVSSETRYTKDVFKSSKSIFPLTFNKRKKDKREDNT